jgi:hypothetical protein
MRRRRRGIWFALSISLAWIVIGFWYLSSHLLALSKAERLVGLGVVTVGWYAFSALAIRRLEAWRGRREGDLSGRAAQPMEAMTVRCEVCDGDEFLEGPSGGLCTNIKCVQCSA